MNKSHQQNSRFFHSGYIWCSFDADCRAGLCVEGTDEFLAARSFASRITTRRNIDCVVFTLKDAESSPVRHEIKSSWS